MKGDSKRNQPSHTQSRFLLLSVSLFAILLAYPFSSRTALGLATFDVMFWSVMLASIYAISRRHWSFFVGLLLVFPAFASDIALYFFQRKMLLFSSCLLDLVFLVFVTGVIIGYVLRPEPVGMDKILGAISAYLLIGLAWALVYGALELSYPGSFRLAQGLAAETESAYSVPHWADLDNFIYFSLVTLSTLGYGDIVAVTRVARSWSAVEAIVGQLYLTILLARLIGLQILQRRKG